MKFTAAIAVAILGFTSHALAHPSMAKRAGSAIDVLQSDLSSMQANVQSDLSSICEFSLSGEQEYNQKYN
jgi:hypothetical protein